MTVRNYTVKGKDITLV